MVQARPGNSIKQSIITIKDTALKKMNKFCYLGSNMTKNLTMDEKISCRIAKAGSAFGKLTKRLWQEHGIRLQTKINVLLSYQLYYMILKRERCIASISRVAYDMSTQNNWD